MSSLTMRHLGVLWLLLSLIGVGCVAGTPDAPPSPTRSASAELTTDLVTVQRGIVSKSLIVPAQVVATTELPVYSGASALVREVSVQTGDRVQTGDLLIELDLGYLNSQRDPLLRAEAELTLAEAEYNEALADHEYRVLQANLALELARLQLSQSRANAAVLSASVDRASIAVEDAQASVALAEQGAINLTVDQARRALRIAEASYNETIAQQQAQQFSVSSAEISLQRAQAEVDRLAQGPSILLEFALERAQQEVDDLRSVAEIRAPAEGVILAVNVAEGQSVNTTTPVVLMGNVSQLEIVTTMTSEEIALVTEGQAVSVTLSSQPDTAWPGVISELPYPYGSGAQNGGEGAVRIHLIDDTASLRPRDTARVQVTIDESPDALWVPPEAVYRYEGREFVIVQEGDRQQRVYVDIGIENETQTEILSGLEAGQTVALP